MTILKQSILISRLEITSLNHSTPRPFHNVRVRVLLPTSPEVASARAPAVESNACARMETPSTRVSWIFVVVLASPISSPEVVDGLAGSNQSDWKLKAASTSTARRNEQYTHGRFRK